jgi:hypothetical protein
MDVRDLYSGESYHRPNGCPIVACLRFLYEDWSLPDDSARFAGHVDDLDEEGE